MRLVLGLDAPSAGSVTVSGRPYATYRRPLFEVGAMLEATAFHGGRSARNHLQCLALSNGIGRARVNEVLDLVGLNSAAGKRAGGFSLGMGQRLGIAAALLGDPPVLMLDEPVNGLDPEGVLWIRTLLKSLAAEGRTVFLSSHLMSEMSLTADRLIIGRGRLIAQATVEDFLSGGPGNFVRVRSPQSSALAALLETRGVTVARQAGNTLRVTGATSAAVGELARVNGLTLQELSEHQTSLEDRYMELTSAAYFADYILPMGVGSERHDLHSYEQYDGQWIGFRQPVLRAARERLGSPVADTREVNPGEVWEENEFWIELSWRIDPDGSLGIRRYYESRERPGQKLTVEEYYRHIFEHSVPGLPEAAAAEGLRPLGYMRRYGAFEIRSGIGAVHEQEVPAGQLEDITEDSFGRVCTRAAVTADPNAVPVATPEGDADGRRPAGVRVDGVIRRGFPTPSGRLEFWSRTLADWGWPEHALPGYIRSHVHPAALGPGQMVLISTFRLPTQIHTRGANAKWLNELAHTNPLWIHPRDARRLQIPAGGLVRVETEIGYFVVKAWVTEGIRPGVVACSHHMGRWKLAGAADGGGQEVAGPRQVAATV